MAETTAEQLAREFAALNTATARAHAAIADLKQARADLRAEREAVEELCRKVGTVTHKRAEELIEFELQRQFEPLVPKVKELLDQSTAHVQAKFDEFAGLLLGKTHPGGKDLETEVRNRVRRNGPMRRPR